MTQGSNHRCLALASELGSGLSPLHSVGQSMKEQTFPESGHFLHSVPPVWVPLLESPWETQTVVWWVGVQSVAEA